MATMSVEAGVSEQSVEAIVIRCTCKVPNPHPGEVCPNGRVEDLGKIAYWHKSPIKRLQWRLSQLLKKASK